MTHFSTELEDLAPRSGGNTRLESFRHFGCGGLARPKIAKHALPAGGKPCHKRSLIEAPRNQPGEGLLAGGLMEAGELATASGAAK